MLDPIRVGFVVSGVDIAIITLTLLNLVLLYCGLGKFAIYNAIDSVLYLFVPKLSLKYDYRRYFPRIAKDYQGNVLETFQTSRDEYYPEYGPLHERAGDFLLRFPFFSIIIYFILLPFFMHYADMIVKILKTQYPILASLTWFPSLKSRWLQLFIPFFFLPFSSLHTMQISAYTLIVYPFLYFVKFLVIFGKFLLWLLRRGVPEVLLIVGFVFLFCVEVLFNYVGFFPLFHKGLIPFIENGPGLKQFIFWSPIKFKLFMDLILIPVVMVIPLITSVGGYILARNETQKTKENINFLVLFYKTGIAYFFGPLFSFIFPHLGEESKEVRSERKINEVLVMCMYLESCVCVAGTGYAYYSVAKTSNLPMSGIFIGLIVLLVFVPLIVFSTNGFQSYFLDSAIEGLKKAKPNAQQAQL